MNKRALITGITGQDGSYLTEFLLEKGYDVFGVIRRKASENELGNVQHLELVDNLELDYGDVTDTSSMNEWINKVSPDEVYNLAGQSQVRVSFDIPWYTTQVNAIGPLNLLEAIRQSGRKIKFYQASTSEMYGNSREAARGNREITPMVPVSPYGSAKLFGHHLVKNYREAYDIFAASGIMFNHESPRRGKSFVTQKIVTAAAEISAGLRTSLELGNMAACRDWGHAKDYIRAMWLILQHEDPDDFVIATGKSRSVHSLVTTVFDILNLDRDKYVTTNDKLRRPNELSHLVGDSTKAKNMLGWEPEISFQSMLSEMIVAASNRIARKGKLIGV